MRGTDTVKPGLKSGTTFTHHFKIVRGKLVPHIYPESDIFREMPEVFATGYFVGLVEWACVECIRQYVEDDEITLGTHIDLHHLAPTPAGLTVSVEVVLETIEARSMKFSFRAFDEVEDIGHGSHTRTLVKGRKFEEKVALKRHLNLE
jgi:fluoroacetyl-CoA thioesterase